MTSRQIDPPAQESNNNGARMRPVRSFVLREGRITPGQRKAMERLQATGSMDAALDLMFQDPEQ